MRPTCIPANRSRYRMIAASRDRRRWLDDDLQPFPHQAHRGNRFIVAHRKHIDIVFAQKIEIDFADRRAQSVANSLRHDIHVARSATHRFVRVGRAFGFRGEDLDIRTHRARGDCSAADQSAAADGRDDRVEILHFTEQLARRGSLPSNHARIGERVHERRARFVRDALGHFIACSQRGGANMQSRAKGFDTRNFDGDRAFRNDDMRGDSPRARRERDGRAVIAGRMRDDAAPGDFIRQRPHRVARAAKLKCARALKVFALERHLATGDLIDRGRR